MIRESEHFHFAGRKSTEFGIRNVSIDEGLHSETIVANKEINEVSIPGRDKPYFINITEEPKTIQLKFAFEERWNERLIHEVTMWLNVNTYQPLFFNEDIDRVFYVLPVEGIEKVHNGLKEGYLILNMRCNSSKSYSHRQITKEFDTRIIGGTNLINAKTVFDSGVRSSSGAMHELVTDREEVVGVITELEEDIAGYSYLWSNSTGVGLTSHDYPAYYTVSAFIKATEGTRYRFGARNDTVRDSDTNESFYSEFEGTGSWERIVVTCYFAKEYKRVLFLWGGVKGAKIGDTIEISDLKYERGSEATPISQESPTITIGNKGHFSTYPEIWIEKVADGDIVIYNKTNNNEKFEFKNIDLGEKVYIDCEKEIINSDKEKTYRYDDFNDNYLEIIYGENILVVTDNVKIRFRMEYVFS